MLFQGVLTVPPNTSVLRPVTAVVEIGAGVSDYVWLGFPPGCSGLVHVAVFYWHWQIWPFTPRATFAWDGYVFVFRDRYPFTAAPYELTLRGWSEDDFYSHDVTFAVTVEPMPPMREVSALEMLLMNRRRMYEGSRMP